MKVPLVYTEADYDRIMEEALADLKVKPEKRKHQRATDRLVEEVTRNTIN